MAEEESTSNELRPSCGLELNCVPNLVEELKSARSNHFEFLVIPLAHPRNERNLIEHQKTNEPFTRSDLLLHSSQWNSLIVGKISPWIQIDSPFEQIYKNSIKALKQEMAWATHLGLPACILPIPSFDCGNYATTVNQTLLNIHYMQLWLRVPLVSNASLYGKLEEQRKSYNARPLDDPWQWWNNFRTTCDHHPLLSIALELTEDLPDPEEIARWLGEPVKALIIPTKIFLTNKQGYPTLSKRHQALIFSFFKHKVQFIFKGKPRHKDNMLPYLQYLHFLASKVPPQTEKEQMEGPYHDLLQAPLQPLMDNLESQTYETFERDGTKYRKYYEAVYKALMKKKSDSKTVLMVVGAGRGPLVKASLKASRDSKRAIKVYAVEKNPNAVITLQNLRISEKWGDQVTIVDSDMRDWDAPEKADILVSELLGSFGDNELSPECLDGAQRFLKDDGISIPCASTSYIAPISSSRLYNEVKIFKETKSFETSYVVKIHNAYTIAHPQQCFYFYHPNRDPIIDNTRYKVMEFIAKESTTLHGFAGYFDSQLFEDVYLSIHPDTHTEGMFSWFPLFFPIKQPMYVPKGSLIRVHFWRNVSRTKVWYEWTITSPDNTTVHNPQGRSHWIGL